MQDAFGQVQEFQPISIIHHRGEIIQDTTVGHYQADVYDKSTNKWFRTSDDAPPIEIQETELTNLGYIFLYKRTDI